MLISFYESVKLICPPFLDPQFLPSLMIEIVFKARYSACISAAAWHLLHPPQVPDDEMLMGQRLLLQLPLKFIRTC